MEKKNYYTPEAKFHQLMVKSVILGSGEGADQGDDDEENDAKGFSSLSFDEDE